MSVIMVGIQEVTLLFIAVITISGANGLTNAEQYCKYVDKLSREDKLNGEFELVQHWLQRECKDAVLGDIVKTLATLVDTGFQDGAVNTKGNAHRIMRRQVPTDSNDVDDDEDEEEEVGSEEEENITSDEVSQTEQLKQLRDSLKRLQVLQDTIDRRQGYQIRTLENLMEDFLKQGNDEWKNQMEEFERRVEIWEAEKYVVKQVQELEDENADVKNRMRDLLHTIMRLQSLVLGMDTRKEALEGQVAALVIKNDRLENEMNTTRAAVQQASQETLQPLQSRLEQLFVYIRAQQNVTAAIQRNWHGITDSLQSVQSITRDLDVSTSLMKDETFERISSLSAQLEQLKTNYASLNNFTNDLRGQFQNLALDNDKIQVEFDISHERYNDLEQSISQEMAKKNELTGIQDMFTKINNTLNEMGSTEKSQYTELDTRMKNIENVTSFMENKLGIIERKGGAIQKTTVSLGQSYTCLSQQMQGHECYFADCSELYRYGAARTSGIYTIKQEDNPSPMGVWCDMETDGGGWTVFQRRYDGSEDFYRNWTDFKNGFGDVDKEHWLGNDNINRFTKNGKFMLRVYLEDWRGDTRYANYDVFRVEDEANKYYLRVGGYKGDAGDSMVYHHGAEFSTHDVDNDGSAAENAAQRWKGGWWYRRGWNANPNGLYYQNGLYTSQDEWTDGIVWDKWQSWWYSLKGTKLMIKRKDV